MSFDIEHIEAELSNFVESLQIVDSFKSAIRYSLFPAGKRIRPRIALAILRDLNSFSANCIRPVLALELIHAASLVHDDLPAIDNDDYRRGKLSCHKVFGEAVAILVGDALNAYAFTLLQAPTVSAETRSLLVASLAKAFADVCHGQHCDLLATSEKPGRSFVDSLKTGSLFRASFEFGAILSSNNEIVTSLGALGADFGAIFQLVDDLQDGTQNQGSGEELGLLACNSVETFRARLKEWEREYQLSLASTLSILEPLMEI
jgi:geranylgeranyl diphosphate synthase type II